MLAFWVLTMKLLPMDEQNASCCESQKIVVHARKVQEQDKDIMGSTKCCSKLWARLSIVLCNVSMLLYSCIACASYCQAALESFSLLFLRDTTQLSAGGVAIASSVFPAGLVASLLVVAP